MIKQDLIRNYAQSMERERNKLGFTQKQMAQSLDMSLSQYKKIISGQTANISLVVSHRMHELTGKWTFELCGEPSPDVELVKKMRNLSESQKRFVKGIVDFESNFVLQPEETDDYISVCVPTGNMEDGMIYDSSNIIKVNISPYRKIFGQDLHFGIKVTSSHLHPVYHPGDILLVCRESIRDGDTGIFLNRETHCMYIRKLKRGEPCMLQSINGLGRDILIDESNHEDSEKWLRIGYVLAKMRT